MPDHSPPPCRKRNLWVLLPKARPRNLGLQAQPPPEALYWTLEGDPCWRPMPAGWATQAGLAWVASTPRRGKHHPAPGQGTLWQSVEPQPHAPTISAAQPFLRWPGGKRYLLPRIRDLLAGFPCHEHDYLEPMIGGGASFWKFGGQFRTRTIGDLNSDLVTLYRTIRNDVEGLIRVLGSGAYEYLGKHDPASLARFRHLLRSEPTSPQERAARYLYLNRSCWGGMMRTTRAGRLAASPNLQGTRICDPGRLRACSAALQTSQILRGSAHQVIRQARAAHPERNFLLVLDPPYHDPGKRFVEYAGTFTKRDQAELVKAVLQSGWRFIYTNKATDYVVSLFSGVPGVEQITLPLRHKLGSGRVETELLVHNLI